MLDAVSRVLANGRHTRKWKAAESIDTNHTGEQQQTVLRKTPQVVTVNDASTGKLTETW